LPETRRPGPGEAPTRAAVRTPPVGAVRAARASPKPARRDLASEGGRLD